MKMNFGSKGSFFIIQKRVVILVWGLHILWFLIFGQSNLEIAQAAKKISEDRLAEEVGKLYTEARAAHNNLPSIENERLKESKAQSAQAMVPAKLNPYANITISQQDYSALERIVQAEAGGEPEEGKILVAQVILNRVINENFANSIYDIIFEKIGGSAQFSPTVDGRFETVKVTPEVKDAVKKALYGKDISNGALFFLARDLADPNNMAWFDSNLKWLFKCGGHEFYTIP